MTSAVTSSYVHACNRRPASSLIWVYMYFVACRTLLLHLCRMWYHEKCLNNVYRPYIFVVWWTRRVRWYKFHELIFLCQKLVLKSLTVTWYSKFKEFTSYATPLRIECIKNQVNRLRIDEVMSNTSYPPFEDGWTLVQLFELSSTALAMSKYM